MKYAEASCPSRSWWESEEDKSRWMELAYGRVILAREFLPSSLWTDFDESGSIYQHHLWGPMDSEGQWGRKYSLFNGVGISYNGGGENKTFLSKQIPKWDAGASASLLVCFFSNCSFRWWGQWEVCMHLKLHTRDCNTRGEHLFSYLIFSNAYMK